jgi:hypothetical protein
MPIPERSKSSRGMRHTGGLKKVLDLEVPNREGPAVMKGLFKGRRHDCLRPVGPNVISNHIAKRASSRHDNTVPLNPNPESHSLL